MIRTDIYHNAYREVYAIIQHLENEDKQKIPQAFIAMLKNNMNMDYVFKYDNSKSFEQQTILQETKNVLAYIYIHYLGDEREVKIIKEKLKNDIIKNEEKKAEKYSNTDLFAKHKKIIENEKQDENLQLALIKKENIFTKLMKKIKAFFIK